MVLAVDGHAVGAGLVLALPADYRVGPAGDSKFRLTEARVGIPFPAAPMEVLKAELAPPAVRFTTLQAHIFDAQSAKSLGILDEIQKPDRVVDRAIEIASDMAQMPADSFWRVKQQVRGETYSRLTALASERRDPMLGQWLSERVRELPVPGDE